MTKGSKRPIRTTTSKHKNNICVDTGFLHALSDGNEKAINYFEKLISSTKTVIFLPTIAIAEFYKTSHKKGKKDKKIREILDKMDGVRFIEKIKLCENIAKQAGKISFKTSVPMSDSIVAATMQNNKCYTLLTSDGKHFGFLTKHPYRIDVEYF